MIVEGFIDFDYEITQLTVRARNADGDIDTYFCEPIGHLQQHGDYVESRQPQAKEPGPGQKARDHRRRRGQQPGRTRPVWRRAVHPWR